MINQVRSSVTVLLIAVCLIGCAAVPEAGTTREGVPHDMAVRSDLAAKQVGGPQRTQYEQTLNALKQEEQRLDRSIKRLSEM